MEKTNPKHIVREGYDKLSTAYRAAYAVSHATQYITWIDRFLSDLPEGSAILELGCGDGIPVAQTVCRRYTYLGVDISPGQIQLARQNVPAARFAIADMTELSFPPGSFQGVLALYSLIHVPLTQQQALIDTLYEWLTVGGYVLVTVGAQAWTGTEDNWLVAGTTMYWSHTDAETYCLWFSAAGFTIVEAEFIPEGKDGHTLILAKKSGQ